MFLKLPKHRHTAARERTMNCRTPLRCTRTPVVLDWIVLGWRQQNKKTHRHTNRTRHNNKKSVPVFRLFAQIICISQRGTIKAYTQSDPIQSNTIQYNPNPIQYNPIRSNTMQCIRRWWGGWRRWQAGCRRGLVSPPPTSVCLSPHRTQMCRLFLLSTVRIGFVFVLDLNWNRMNWSRLE